MSTGNSNAQSSTTLSQILSKIVAFGKSTLHDIASSQRSDSLLVSSPDAVTKDEKQAEFLKLIQKFNKETLAHTSTTDKSGLNPIDAMLSTVAHFQKDALVHNTHVGAPDAPLTFAKLLIAIDHFDKAALSAATTDDKSGANIAAALEAAKKVPSTGAVTDETKKQILAEISAFSTASLIHAETKDSSNQSVALAKLLAAIANGAELKKSGPKSEIAGLIADFKKETLVHAATTDKSGVNPVDAMLTAVAHFQKKALSHNTAKDTTGSALTLAKLLVQIDTFDKSALSAVETDDKSAANVAAALEAAQKIAPVSVSDETKKKLLNEIAAFNTAAFTRAHTKDSSKQTLALAKLLAAIGNGTELKKSGPKAEIAALITDFKKETLAHAATSDKSGVNPVDAMLTAVHHFQKTALSQGSARDTSDSTINLARLLLSIDSFDKKVLHSVETDDKSIPDVAAALEHASKVPAPIDVSDEARKKLFSEINEFDASALSPTNTKDSTNQAVALAKLLAAISNGTELKKSGPLAAIAGLIADFKRETLATGHTADKSGVNTVDAMLTAVHHFQKKALAARGLPKDTTSSSLNLAKLILQIDHFDKSALNSVETDDKSAANIAAALEAAQKAQEKSTEVKISDVTKKNLLSEIAAFDYSALAHADTKDTSNTSVALAKLLAKVSTFDKEQLVDIATAARDTPLLSSSPVPDSLQKDITKAELISLIRNFNKEALAEAKTADKSGLNPVDVMLGAVASFQKDTLKHAPIHDASSTPVTLAKLLVSIDQFDKKALTSVPTEDKSVPNVKLALEQTEGVPVGAGKTGELFASIVNFEKSSLADVKTEDRSAPVLRTPEETAH